MRIEKIETRDHCLILGTLRDVVTDLSIHFSPMKYIYTLSLGTNDRLCSVMLELPVHLDIYSVTMVCSLPH